MEITKQGNQIYIDSSFLEHVNNYINSSSTYKMLQLRWFIVITIMAILITPIICLCMSHNKKFELKSYVNDIIWTYIDYLIFIGIPFLAFYFLF